MMIYIYILIMTIIGSFAALFLKKASRSNNIRLLLMNINFYLGGGLYFISALINIYVLKYLPYSVVLPMTSITYIWTMIISYILLKEIITFKKVIGISFIIIGAVVLAFPF